MLLSNGLPHPKIRLKKFGFSPKSVPANIAKKLPPQRCSKPFLIAFFSLSHKRPTFAFTGESGYTLGFRRKIAHNGPHGETEAFPSAITVRLCAASEIPFIPPCFYIHTFPGSLWPLTIGRREKVSEDAPATLSPTIPHCVFQLRSQMAHVCFHRRKWVHTRLSEKDRTQRHTRRKRGAFRMGPQSLPSTRTARSRTSPGRVLERRTLPLLGLGWMYSRRTQKAFGTAMRLCTSLSRRRRGPAGLRDLFAFVEMVDLYIRRSWFSACARRGVVSPLLVCSACC